MPNGLQDKIVVVDDEPNIRETISFILKCEGYEVLKACNGKEALEIIKQEKPKVVLLDVMMPLMNGYEVLQAVKQNNELKNIFIIMLTAKGQKSDKQKALSLGADKYLTKPFNDDDVLSIITSILGNNNQSLGNQNEFEP